MIKKIALFLCFSAAKDFISCQRMAVAQHCGDEAAKYVSDFFAHGFQIIINAKGEDCDVTGEG